jgi:hypothetical protein
LPDLKVKSQNIFKHLLTTSTFQDSFHAAVIPGETRFNNVGISFTATIPPFSPHYLNHLLLERKFIEVDLVILIRIFRPLGHLREQLGRRRLMKPTFITYLPKALQFVEYYNLLYSVV